MKTKKSFLWLAFLILATIWILVRHNQQVGYYSVKGLVFGTVYKITSPDNSRVVRQPEQPSVIEFCGIAKCHLRLYRSNDQHCQQKDKSSPVILKIHFHIDFL